MSRTGVTRWTALDASNPSECVGHRFDSEAALVMNWAFSLAEDAQRPLWLQCRLQFAAPTMCGSHNAAPIRRAVPGQGGGQRQSDRPAGRPLGHRGDDGEPGMVIDPGHHLHFPQLPGPGIGDHHPADNVDPLQLHRAGPLPAAVRVPHPFGWCLRATGRSTSHDPLPRPLHTGTLRPRGASTSTKHHGARYADPVDSPTTPPGFWQLSGEGPSGLIAAGLQDEGVAVGLDRHGWTATGGPMAG